MMFFYNGRRERILQDTYLHLDQLLDSVDNENVLGAGGRVDADDGFIASVQPPITEGFLSGLLVVQVAQDNVGAANDQLTRCIISGEFLARLGRYNASFDAGEQAARRAQQDILGMRLADNSRCLGET